MIETGSLAGCMPAYMGLLYREQASDDVKTKGVCSEAMVTQQS